MSLNSQWLLYIHFFLDYTIQECYLDVSSCISHLIPTHMDLLKCTSQLVQMSPCSLCILSVRIFMLRILPCIPQCCHLLHAGSCRSIWQTLQTSLQVSIPHPRNHSSWTGTLHPFPLGYFFIAGRLYINDVAQQCHIIGVCLRPLEVSLYYSSFWIISWIVVTCSSEQVSSFFSCR